MARDETITFRIDSEAKAALAALAERDDRTLSYLLGKIIAEYLAAQSKRPRK
jgi:predicted transcriptional regulator